MWPSRLLVQLGFCFLVAALLVHQGTVLSRPQMTSPDEFSIYKLRGGKRERLVNKSLTVLGLKQQQGFTSHVEESKSVKQLNSEPVKMLKTPTSCQWSVNLSLHVVMLTLTYDKLALFNLLLHGAVARFPFCPISLNIKNSGFLVHFLKRLSKSDELV